MSLQKYLALLKTVELGSISLAAEQMGYTQPAVSRMIADLEAQWKVELLRRNRSGLEPSAACLQLLPILRSLQADCDALNFAVSEIHGAHTGLVRVGIFTSVADMWIPGLMKSFRQQYPKIEFELINMESYVEIESNIRQGKVDCGFVRLPTVHDLQVHFLMRDELVAVLPPDHPLADAPVFPVAQLADAPFIRLREKEDLEVSQFLDRIPDAPDFCYEVGSDHTALSLVEQGLGMTITHSLIANNPRYNVVCKRFDRGQYRDIAIATAKNARLAGTTKLFVEHVISQIGGSQEK
jgi:DNA-binding transcriptional LysR family regulator